MQVLLSIREIFELNRNTDGIRTVLKNGKAVINQSLWRPFT